MKRKTVILSLVTWLISLAGYAQSKKEKEVADAVNRLKEAMISGDSSKLSAISANDLSYGHSGGKIENKTAFVHSIASGSSDFVTIDFSDQKIRVYENTAVVTHILNASTNDNGKPGTVKLSILTVWNKQHGSWKMVARQAVRPQ